jgi:hypothetical protein
MKTNLISGLLISVAFNTMATTFPVKQDSTGLPGDQLDLYAVMELAKKSQSPEEFEKELNKEENKVNNLDLNGDNQTDYIKVIDHSEKEAHALVLQVDINENETQDVAVIEVEKKGDEIAHLQIIGDEELYGKDYIIEPAEETNTKSLVPLDSKVYTTVVVNVWAWPMIPFIYRPAYVIWVSPWKWRAYPVWWKPWRPVHWSVYHPHWHPYHVYHRRVYTHRTVVAHNVYYGHRKVSKTVVQKRTPVNPNHKPIRKVTKEQRIQKHGGNQPARNNQRKGQGKGQSKPGKRK